MKISSLTKEKCQQLRNKFYCQTSLLNDATSKSESDMWLADLHDLRLAYMQEIENENENEETNLAEEPKSKKQRCSLKNKKK